MFSSFWWPAKGRVKILNRLIRSGLLALAWPLLANVAPASATNLQISGICDAAAHGAARRTGVPVAVLQAISLTETGRKMEGQFLPWPWTVNMEGKGEWFDSRKQAQAFADQNFSRGARSFDVGCFQLNYRWHGQAFASINEMFEPAANAQYAAEFLRDLYAEKGNWADAAGAYHSRTPEYSNRYKTRFNRIYARLVSDSSGLPETPHVAAADRPIRTENRSGPVQINRFPLLQGGSSAMASLGSLMPASAGIGARGLFDGG